MLSFSSLTLTMWPAISCGVVQGVRTPGHHGRRDAVGPTPSHPAKRKYVTINCAATEDDDGDDDDMDDDVGIPTTSFITKAHAKKTYRRCLSGHGLTRVGPICMVTWI